MGNISHIESTYVSLDQTRPSHIEAGETADVEATAQHFPLTSDDRSTDFCAFRPTRDETMVPVKKAHRSRLASVESSGQSQPQLDDRFVLVQHPGSQPFPHHVPIRESKFTERPRPLLEQRDWPAFATQKDAGREAFVWALGTLHHGIPLLADAK